MKKIVDYHVVETGDMNKIRSWVRECIEKEGWQPFGSMVIVQYETNVTYIQPMVKYEDEDAITRL